jgi:hypothetical protein
LDVETALHKCDKSHWAVIIILFIRYWIHFAKLY